MSLGPQSGESNRLSRGRLLVVALCALLAVQVACTSPDERAGPSPSVPAGEAPAPDSLPNYRRWSARLIQGGQPEGEEAYAALAARGVTLVLSVDGLPPDLEAARKHGLQVAHVPVGYDGIEAAEALQIVRASRDAQGAIYVHCHHGRHRGPAAAALARIALEGITSAEAERGLGESCSPRYPGLFASVRAFRAPDAAALEAAPAPPVAVRPLGTRSAMLAIDQLWEGLRAAERAGWSSPPAHPDVQPAHQATLLWEAFRELGRLEQAEPFAAPAAESEALSAQLRDALEAGDTAAASAVSARLVERCDSCHADFRN